MSQPDIEQASAQERASVADVTAPISGGHEPLPSTVMDHAMSVAQELSALRAEVAELKQLLVCAIPKIDFTSTLVGPFGVCYPDGTVLVQTLQQLKYFIDG